jgi:hypothetical protein
MAEREDSTQAAGSPEEQPLFPSQEAEEQPLVPGQADEAWSFSPQEGLDTPVPASARDHAGTASDAAADDPTSAGDARLIGG